jgi:uncharacterized repeat protein (TIGR01451 family)
MTNTTRLLTSASALALSALATVPAFAAGTTAGSTINNVATVTYSVGGTPQGTVTSNTVGFVVDRRITLTMTEPGNATTSVAPGATNQVTTFLVTNTSNAPLDLGLSVAQSTAAHSGTDNFDVTTPEIWINTGPSIASATYDPTNSVQVAYLDEIAADASRYVFVLSDVPAGRVTNDVSGIALTAQAREAGVAATQGAIVTATSGANTASMDTVFADIAGATDGATDGRISARDDYTVAAAALTATKTSTIISDPINLLVNPKMIPGATVEYCIVVANAAGGASATAPTISDAVPTQTTFVPGSILINGTSTCTGGAAGGAYTTTPVPTVSGTLADVAPGASSSLRFRVTIN